MAHAPSPCTDAPENAPAWPDLTLHDTTRRNAAGIQSALQPVTAHHPELHGRRCNDSLRRGMRKRMAATRRSDGEGRKLQDASLRDTAHRDAAFRRRRHVIKKAPWLPYITFASARPGGPGRALPPVSESMCRKASDPRTVGSTRASTACDEEVYLNCIERAHSASLLFWGQQ